MGPNSMPSESQHCCKFLVKGKYCVGRNKVILLRCALPEPLPLDTFLLLLRLRASLDHRFFARTKKGCRVYVLSSCYVLLVSWLLLLSRLLDRSIVLVDMY